MKNAIKREQSQACLNYAEREHFGRSQIKAKKQSREQFASNSQESRS